MRGFPTIFFLEDQKTLFWISKRLLTKSLPSPPRQESQIFSKLHELCEDNGNGPGIPAKCKECNPLEILFHCLPWEEILPMKGTLDFFTHDMITAQLPGAPCEEQASCEEICYRCGQRLFTSSLTTRVHILNRFTSCQQLAQVISFTVVYSYRI